MKRLPGVLAGIIIVITALFLVNSLPSAKMVITEEEMEQSRSEAGGVIIRQLQLNKGGILEVELYAHWSAGMKWSATFDNTGIMRHADARRFTYAGPPMTVGGPGHENWKFEAVKEGNATVTMTYNSVANLPDAPFKVNTVVIQIKVG